MATVTDEVIVKLQAQIDGYKRKLSDAENHSTHAFSRINVGVGKLRATLTGLGPALSAAVLGGAGLSGVIALGRAFLDLADKGKQLNATLLLATEQFGNYGQAQVDVRRIAMETRSSLEDTARLYATFTRSANELGITQKEAARATETISKSFLISGASAVEASQGTRQLIQAIQSGTLRGDEFNTMMESAPRLAKLFADSLGVPVTALRSMAEQGKITSQALISALTDPKWTQGLDQQFSKLPITFDQAMTQIENAAQITFSAFDRGGEFSNMLVAFVMSGADSFEELESRAQVMGGELRSTISALYNVFDPLGDNAISVMGTIETTIHDLRASIGGTLRDLQNLYNAVPNLGNRIRQNARNAGIGFLVGDNAPLATFADQYQRDLKQGDFDAAKRRITGNYSGLAADFPIENGPRGNFVPVPAKAKKGRTGKSDAERAAERAERNEDQFQSELERLNVELLQAREAQATAADDVYKFQVQEVEAERDNAKRAIQRESSGKNAKYDDLKAKQLMALQDDIAAAKLAKLAADREQQIAQDRLDVQKAGLQNEIDLKQAQSKFLKTREEQRDAALALLDLQYQQQRIELEAVVASKTASDAQKKIAAARLAILGQLQANDARGVNEQYASPGQKYLQELETGAVNLNDELENLAVDKVRELGGAFGDATAKAFGLKGVLGDLISSLAEMYFKEAVLLPLMRELFGGGGGSGIFGLLGGLFGGGGGGNGIVVTGGAPSAGFDFMRAAGGPVTAGGTYVVGEEGPEIFKPSQSGVIIPNSQARNAFGGGSVVRMVVTPSPYFDMRVQEVTGPVIVQASVRAAQGGSMLARNRLSREALHRLG